MRINKITVNCFRSITSAVDLNLCEFNVFIGQNNHGKTNFFEAIEWFYNGGDIEEVIQKGKEKSDVLVCVEFIDCQAGLERIQTQSHKTKIQNALNGNDSIKVIRRLSEAKKLKYIASNGSETDFGVGIDKALLEFFPRLQFVKTETTLKEIAKYGRKTPMSEMLSEVLEQILEGDGSTEYTAFKEEFNRLFGETGSVGQGLVRIGTEVKSYLSKQFECEKVSFIPNLPTFEDIFKNMTTMVDDGKETTAEEKGDGMQRALMLAIIQTYVDYRRRKENSRDFVFLIDEGELHLHPTAQRNLKNAFLELARGGDQILISTHSSVLIADDNSIERLFKVEKNEHITSISEINDFDKQDVVFDLLGGSPKDLLLPNNFLIVEGESEFEFLNRVIRRFYSEKKRIKILKAFGDIDQVSRLAVSLEKLFTPINESIYQKKVVILIDQLSEEKMSQGAYQTFLRKFPDLDPSVQIRILSVGNIEEYYPDARTDQLDATNSHNYVPKWKRSRQEVDQMTPTQKTKLAKVIGDKIDQAQFETVMPLMFESLETCWRIAY